MNDKKIDIPKILILDKAKLKIYIEEKLRVNKTEKAIIITGNREGFFTFSNYLIYCLNNLEEKINVNLEFIDSKIDFEILIVDNEKEENKLLWVVEKGIEKYIWKLTEISYLYVATDIHSLAYCNDEIHFDDYKREDEISVYCVVSDLT